MSLICLHLQQLQLYRAADLQEERVRILRSLGSVTSPSLISKTLAFALSVSVFVLTRNRGELM